MRGNARILTVLLCLTLILGLCGCSCRHEWVDATCTEPKTCAKCGETQGEALGHTPGEWQQDEPDYVTSVIWLRQYCTVCGAEVDVDMKALSSYCQDGTLLLSPEEFAERLDNLFGTLTNRYGADCDFSAKIMSAEEDSMGCVVANAKGELLCVALWRIFPPPPYYYGSVRRTSSGTGTAAESHRRSRSARLSCKTLR